MNFWLKHTNNDMFVLPVTPSSFDVAVSHKNTVLNVISLGDVNLLGNTGLKSVSLSSLFPAQDYNFSKANREDPKYYVDKIESWRKSNSLIRFIVSGVVNIQCSIESFEWGQKDGTGDIYYTISLQEYKNVSIQKRSTKAIKSATKHKIKKGDTLYKLAKRCYGSSNKTYRDKIYNANKEIIKNKSKLPKGKTIKIPALVTVVYQ